MIFFGTTALLTCDFEIYENLPKVQNIRQHSLFRCQIKRKIIFLLSCAMPLAFFYTLTKYQKTFGLLMSSPRCVEEASDMKWVDVTISIESHHALLLVQIENNFFR